jgi:cytochrome c oxidase cbb3-type subunit 3
MAWRALLAVSLALLALGAVLHLWEQRPLRTTPAAAAATTGLLTMTSVHAGGPPAALAPDVETMTHEELAAVDVAEGKRLYHWFNCNTCHANGGGDIGPPLMDETWIYGGAPRNIFASIVEGRPNGMPSFRGKIPDAQAWQIVAYVRSMSGHVPLPQRPGRSDDLQAKPPESMAPPEPILPGAAPAADRHPTSP